MLIVIVKLMKARNQGNQLYSSAATSATIHY